MITANIKVSDIEKLENDNLVESFSVAKELKSYKMK